jgi:hypothetical protein
VLFRAHTDAELQVLADSIRQLGVIEPVIHDQHGRILDGSGRTRAVAMLDEEGTVVELPVQVIEVTSLEQVIMIQLGANLHRRQMTRPQRDDLIVLLTELGMSSRAVARSMFANEGKQSLVIRVLQRRRRLADADASPCRAMTPTEQAAREVVHAFQRLDRLTAGSAPHFSQAMVLALIAELGDPRVEISRLIGRLCGVGCLVDEAVTDEDPLGLMAKAHAAWADDPGLGSICSELQAWRWCSSLPLTITVAIAHICQLAIPSGMPHPRHEPRTASAQRAGLYGTPAVAARRERAAAAVLDLIVKGELVLDGDRVLRSPRRGAGR